MTARILMVEDDRGLALTRCEFLRRDLAGVQVSALHSESSLESLVTDWATGASQPPDAIILDGRLRWSDTQAARPNLPALKAGVRLIARIRSGTVGADVPIVAYSVDPRAFDGVTADENTRLLSKSDGPFALTEALRSMLSANGHNLSKPRRIDWWGEKTVLRLSALLAAILVIVGVVATVAGWSSHVWHWLVSQRSEDTYSYVLNSSTGTVSIFDDPHAPSLGVRYRMTGETVSVQCRAEVNSVLWIRLTDGGWARSADLRPSVDEAVRTDQLPLCKDQ